MTGRSRRAFGAALFGAGIVAILPARAAPGPRRVTISRFAFRPGRLAVAVGTRVEWLNRDLAPHSAAAADGRFDTGALGRDEHAAVRFDRPGRYAYACAHHPHMTGEIVVGEQENRE